MQCVIIKIFIGSKNVVYLNVDCILIIVLQICLVKRTWTFPYQKRKHIYSNANIHRDLFYSNSLYLIFQIIPPNSNTTSLLFFPNSVLLHVLKWFLKGRSFTCFNVYHFNEFETKWESMPYSYSVEIAVCHCISEPYQKGSTLLLKFKLLNIYVNAVLFL